MDNIKSLMDKKEYELVIKITNGSKKIDDLFYRISAFLALNKAENALKTIEDNRTILENRLPFLMKVNIEILCLLGRFEEAYEKMDYYKNLPYFSMEAEELLAELPKKIRQEELNSFKNNKMSDSEIRKILLSSKDDSLILTALNEIKENEINSFLSILENLMVNYEKKSIRTFVLLMLIKSGINLKMKFLSLDGVIEINPSKLKQPFADDKMIKCFSLLSKNIKDPVILEHSIQLVSTYCLYRFPSNILLSSEEICVGAILSAYDLLSISNDNKKSFLECFSVSKEKTIKAKNEILLANNNF